MEILIVCAVVLIGIMIGVPYVRHEKKAKKAAMASAEVLLNAECNQKSFAVNGVYKDREFSCSFGSSSELEGLVPGLGSGGSYLVVTKLRISMPNSELDKYPHLKSKYTLHNSALCSREAEYVGSDLFGKWKKITTFNLEKLPSVIEDMYQTANMLEGECGES